MKNCTIKIDNKKEFDNVLQLLETLDIKWRGGHTAFHGSVTYDKNIVEYLDIMDEVITYADKQYYNNKLYSAEEFILTYKPKEEIIYTIQDLSEGKVIMEFEGNFEELKKILLVAFPEDSYIEILHDRGIYSKRKYFFAVDESNGDWLSSDSITQSISNLPIQKTNIFYKQLNNNKEMKEMKEFAIEGSAALREAFAKELNMELLTSGSITTFDYLIYKNNKVLQGGIGCTNKVLFTLPNQWDEAIKYVKEYIEFRNPKPIEITINGYTAEFNKKDKTVKFGCHIINLEELKALKVVNNLREKLEYTSLTFYPNHITPNSIMSRELSFENIDKLIKGLE